MLSVLLSQPAPIPLDVNLECAAGELLALVGPSGSGKTSVLRAIAGLLRPKRGEVRLDSDRWFDSARHTHVPAERRPVGMVFQQYALFPHLTARANIQLAMRKQAAPDLADRLLQDMHLQGMADRRPHELSGGQRQRVALARALAREPKVLLLDEAFSAVDQPTRVVLYEELIALRERVQLPIIMVTHDLREARQLADRICIIQVGRTLQAGPPEQVIARPRNELVASLVGIRDIHDGVFRKTSQPGQARLDWGGPENTVPLVVQDKGKIEDGTAVKWVVAPQFVHLGQDRRDQPNEVPCRIEFIRALGAVSTLLCMPLKGPQSQLHVDATTSRLRELQVAAGDTVHLRFEPEGIHVMPLKRQRAASAN